MSKIIFTNGVFDANLHYQHVNLLLYCRTLAGPDGQVFVGLDLNSKAEQDKGPNRPYFSYEEREDSLYAVSANGLGGCYQIVDRVFPFGSDSELLQLIKDLKVDIIVKGADWEKKKVVGSEVAQVNLFQRDNEVSTTKIVERILENEHSCCGRCHS